MENLVAFSKPCSASSHSTGKFVGGRAKTHLARALPDLQTTEAILSLTHLLDHPTGFRHICRGFPSSYPDIQGQVPSLLLCCQDSKGSYVPSLEQVLYLLLNPLNQEQIQSQSAHPPCC